MIGSKFLAVGENSEFALVNTTMAKLLEKYPGNSARKASCGISEYRRWMTFMIAS